jgi:RHS repeat-associated protein
VSAAAYYEPPNSQPRSTPAGSGSPCEKETRSSTCWADHVSASLPQARPASRRTRAGRRYLRCATSRGARGATPTTFKFTGQRQETEIGLYFYNARWYDPALGRFVQADPVVPNPGYIQDWDRYAYVRNNPINCVDTSGHTPWFINGWNNSYLFQQSGNTCAVASIAVSLSILRGHSYAQAEIQPIFFHTYDRKDKLPFDSSGKLTWPINPHAKWEERNLAPGVIPYEQALCINTMFPGQIRATLTQGSRADLLRVK